MTKAFLIVLFLFSNSLFSQNEQTDSVNTRKKNTNFFSSFGVTVFSEYMTTRAIKTDRYFFYGTNPNGDPLSDTIHTFDYGQAITLLTMTFELRWNLYNYLDKGSVSISAPLAFSANFNSQNLMIGSLTFPMIIDANYGMHATYNNIDKYGIHAGLGYQGILGGLFPMSDTEGGQSVFWTQPVCRIGMKFPVKKSNCFVDVYYGLGKKVSVVESHDHATNIDTLKIIHTKFYLKLAFGWLINYD